MRIFRCAFISAMISYLRGTQLQRSAKAIAITIPIKSSLDYKNSVKDCAKGAVKDIVGPMSFPASKQNQPEVAIPFDDIPVELVDEPIAVAAAYAP